MSTRRRIMMQHSTEQADVYDGFTFIAHETSVLSMIHVGSNATSAKPNLEYSRDGKIWTNWDFSPITIPINTKLYFRGNNPSGVSRGEGNYSNFVCTEGALEVKGNVMSLLSISNYKEMQTVPRGSFHRLFCYVATLMEASRLRLPANEVGAHGYDNMFTGTSITTLPSLPATKLENNAYRSMFSQCPYIYECPELPALDLGGTSVYRGMFWQSGLVKAPSILPATKLYNTCYQGMFKECANLEKTPELPALDVSSDCYKDMFRNCPKVDKVKALFTSTATSHCSNWLEGVSPTGTFIANKSATWPQSVARGVSSIPVGWTLEVE